MKVFSVEDPVFKTEPVFVIGATHRQLVELCARRRWRVDVGPEEPHAAGRMFTFNRAPWRIVWSLAADRAVVLHEVFHLVTRICYDKGIVIRAHDERGDNGDEAAAYMFEHFARAVLKRIR